MPRAINRTWVTEERDRVAAARAEGHLLRDDDAMQERRIPVLAPNRQNLAGVDQDRARQVADASPLRRARQLGLQPTLGVLRQQRERAVVAVRPAPGDGEVFLAARLRRLRRSRRLAVRIVAVGFGLLVVVTVALLVLHVARRDEVDAFALAALLAVLAATPRHLALVVVLLDDGRVVQEAQRRRVLLIPREHVGMVLDEKVRLQIWAKEKEDNNASSSAGGFAFVPRLTAIACNNSADRCLKSSASSPMWSLKPGNGSSGNDDAFSVQTLNACRNSGVEPSNFSWPGFT